MAGRNTKPLGTKLRLLQAAETLFVDHGYEALSLRQITRAADANLAAVNYHFGSKEQLLHQLLTDRLAQLHDARLALFDGYQRRGLPLGLDALLGILFVPMLQASRRKDGMALMRLLSRLYSDPSPFIHDFLEERHKPIYARLFEAFATALPQVSRPELAMRMHFCMVGMARLMADENLEYLLHRSQQGKPMDDTELLARMLALVGPMIVGAPVSHAQWKAVEQVLALVGEAPPAETT